MFGKCVCNILLVHILLQVETVRSSPVNQQEVMRLQERGIVSYVQDVASGLLRKTTSTLSSTFVNAVEKLADSIDDKCESDGHLNATEEGKKSCQERCMGIGAQVLDAVTKATNTLPRLFGNGDWFTVVSNDHHNLPAWRCVPNIPGDALICDCPRAPKIRVTKEVQNEFNGFLMEVKDKKKHHHHHHLSGPYKHPFKALFAMFGNMFIWFLVILIQPFAHLFYHFCGHHHHQHYPHYNQYPQYHDNYPPSYPPSYPYPQYYPYH